MAYGTVSVTTSATKILSEALPRRRAALIQPVDGDIYIGFDSSVTTANGLAVLQYGKWKTGDPQPYQGEIWGISSGTVDVRYEELK